QEAVNEIAMRAMDFDQIETRPLSALRTVGESRDNFKNSGLVQRLRRLPTLIIWDRARSHRLPCAFLRRQHLAAPAFCDGAGCCLASGMGQLDAERSRRTLAQLRDHPGERRLLRVS